MKKSIMLLSVASCFNRLIAAEIIHGSLSNNGKELYQYEAAFH
jgi:hypothetical protein